MRSIRYLRTLAPFSLILILALSTPATAQLQKTVCLLKGELVTSDGQKLSGATVAIYNGTEKVTTTRSNTDGKFTAIVHPATTYRVTFTHPQYSYNEETVVVPATEKYLEVPLHASLRPLHDGQAFALSQPVFMEKSATIEQSALSQLDEIVNEVKHNPKLTLTITVYPDHPIKNPKKDVKEQQLAAGRSNAITSFLLSNGVSAKSFSIVKSTDVPDGQFPRTITTAAKKKKKATTERVMIPQYVQIQAHLG